MELRLLRLREHLRLTGTHVGCDTAQCGACTVIADGRAIKSCNVLALQMQGADITTVEGKRDFVRNLVAYNVILEGIWFYSGFMVALSFRQRNLLRNFASLIDWIVRDESLHLNFGINLILTVLEENPEVASEKFSEEIRSMVLEAVEMEEAYNGDLLPNGILGLNADYINQYVKYLADRRLEELGFEPEYRGSNPAKWMATANDTLQLVNFFESINTSYEVDARSSH